jgi:ribosomal protein L11 methyltransferase
MAFGTGLHPTTRFCLRAVERDKLGPEILDVGTGSGILAIAAVLMDDSLNITAIDNDPVSIKVAEENCQLNGVDKRIELLVGTTDVIVGRKFDDLLSNLTCEVIVSLLPDYRRILKPGGRVICAGVLLEKAEKLETAAKENGFEVLTREPEGIWCGLILKMTA